VVGLLEAHGCGEIAKLAEGLEIIPRRRQEYHGLIVEEMDVGAILACKPEVALINELAHANVSGHASPKKILGRSGHSCRRDICHHYDERPAF
jgi:two-component system sensor histidine kinase KdpD